MATMEKVLQRNTLEHPKCDDIRLGTADCRCGQDLDRWLRSHCPRCGTCLDSH